MGYYSSMEGSFTVTPPPPASRLDLSKLKTTSQDEWALECIRVVFEKDSTTETEEDGTEVTRSKVNSVQLESCNVGEHKHYHVADGLQMIVNHFGKHREYKGYFELDGEDGEKWRFVVVDGLVKKIEPTITWPVS